MERAFWREVLGQVRAWGSEVFISSKVLPQANLAWLWMRLGNLLWLEVLQDQCPDEMVSLSAEPKFPENQGSLPICPSASPLGGHLPFPSCDATFPVAWSAALFWESSMCEEASLSRGKGSSGQVM